MYVKAIPNSIRQSSLIKRLKETIPHDLVYDEKYYDRVEGSAHKSAPVMAASIVSDLRPATLIDVGCGTGALLEALRDRGCTVRGLEYAEAGLKACRARGLNVAKFNLERDCFDPQNTFDVAVSMEVAEHIPEHCADGLVSLLSSVAPVVVFTAAFPGQGGDDHVNEQPASYWIEKFDKNGFSLDNDISERWRNNWKDSGIARWYFLNIMVFRRSEKLM